MATVLTSFKTIHKHIIKASGDVFELQELFRKTMDVRGVHTLKPSILIGVVRQPIMKPLRDKNIFYPAENCLTLHPFRPTKLMSEEKGRFYRSQLSNLSTLARGVLYLVSQYAFTNSSVTTLIHEIAHRLHKLMSRLP